MGLGKRIRIVFLLGGGMGASLLGLAFLVLVAPRVVAHYSWSVERLFRQAPAQPIAFSHKTHAGDAQIPCLFCHRGAAVEEAAGIPSLQECMFCHRLIVGTTEAQQAEIRKVIEAFGKERPVQWVRVFRLPDHARFVHEAHIRAGFTCADCHGAVETMREVRQVHRSLKMGDCVGCHRQHGAPTDCATCHY
jgi:hypothetical protein